MATLEIAGRTIGAGESCFIIAEAGVNHNGDLDLARRLIDRAVAAGADAIKFQTFRAERLVTRDAAKAAYQRETANTGESQFEMLRRLELDAYAHRVLMEHSRQAGILFLSSPFDVASADLLEELAVPAFKIPSGQITNLPYLVHIARKRKPMIVSTGMSSLGEVEAAVRTIQSAGNSTLALLQCTSNYPADPDDVNLRAMQTMAAAFGLPVGYSDHTLGIAVPLAAVALGACIVEKHLTLDRTLPGPDQRASLEPDELAAMVQGIRTVEAALGDGCKIPSAGEMETAAAARTSLVAARDIPAGTRLTAEMIACKRPGTGLPPALVDYLTGHVARVDIRTDTLLALEMFG